MKRPKDNTILMVIDRRQAIIHIRDVTNQTFAVGRGVVFSRSVQFNRYDG